MELAEARDEDEGPELAEELAEARGGGGGLVAALEGAAATSAGAALRRLRLDPLPFLRAGCRSGSAALSLRTTAHPLRTRLITYSALLFLKRRCDRTPGTARSPSSRQRGQTSSRASSAQRAGRGHSARCST